MDIYVDGEKRGTQNFTDTGGWQVWKTFHNSINLESGKHRLRLVATSSGFNINWTEVGEITSGIAENREARAVIYPNPAQDLIYLTNTGNAARIEIVDVAGRTVLRAPMTQRINIGFLPDGYYIVNFISEKNEMPFHGAFMKRN
jgi:hypothetical protein